MQTDILLPLLACPACKGALVFHDDALSCAAPDCSASPRQWPIVGGVPVLIDERASLFSVQALADRHACPAPPRRPGELRQAIIAWTPSLSRNHAEERNAVRLVELLAALPRRGRVLVIGCGDGSLAARLLQQSGRVDVVSADVRWTACVDLICDGHDLPLADGKFDAVVVQGVLEHVLRPPKVAAEIYRVLAPGGLVYCEYPFLQPTHGGAYDFSRLTYTGHRMLWREFECVDAGACCGPGMALANCTQQFFRALMPTRKLRALSDLVTSWTLWWLKYVDKYVTNRPAALDGASAYYFLGRKAEQPAEDTAIVAAYKGAQ